MARNHCPRCAGIGAHDPPEYAGAAKSFGLLFQRGNFLRVITVFAVIQAVLFLALDKLNDGAIAVLSAVAGFVLGGLDKPKIETSDKAGGD